MDNKLAELQLKLKSLTIFHALLTQPIFIRLHHLLTKSQETSLLDRVEAIAQFGAVVLEQGANVSDIIFSMVMDDENAYVIEWVKNKEIPSLMEASLLRELSILKEVSLLTCEDFHSEGMDGLCTSWYTSDLDFVGEYRKRIRNIHTCGYGMYAKYHMFSVVHNEIIPIRFPDGQTLEEFSEYERERALVVKNTEALLKGVGASNMLLYGDAGTGKSSTIKAVVNQFKTEGLRLVEVKKNQLHQIPSIIEVLASNPLKFILFIDDLSFASNDENFAALKSVLEGGASAVGNNVVIYATSNRRHLVREDHQSRAGDEIHLNDTLQETMSLSARFGLIVTFNAPDKDVYLQIVKQLATQYNIAITQDALIQKAEAYAIRHHGRSPRTAKQFIELLKAGF